ncbi:MAG: hypothetical protein ACI9R3_003403 [Verrucomicrobiales bacterium]|jgi:hypothetical protein
MKPYRIGVSFIAGLALWTLSVLQAIGDETHYRVEGMASSSAAQLEAVRLLVPWVSVSTTTGQMQARVVFRNVSRTPAQPFGLMGKDDYQLLLGNGKRLSSSSSSDSLAIVIPAEGLAPTQSNSGVLTFDLPAEVTKFGDSASLQVSRFQPVAVQLVPGRVFSPPPLGVQLPVQQVLRSSHDSMSLVALEVDSAMITAEGKLVLSIGFRNVGRANLNVSTRLSGKDARLADGELNVHAPDAISPALTTSIIPGTGVLEAGTPHSGTVRFSISHPVAAEQWQFFYPGYQRMGAQWNAQKNRFLVKVLDDPAVPPVNASGAGGELAADERRFRKIDALLGRLNKNIAAGNTSAYLAALPPHLRESHARLLREHIRVGARDLEYRLPPLQKFQPSSDGVVRNVQLSLRYQLNDGAQNRPMVASAVASFAGDRGQWRMVDCRFVRAAPFWLLGYVDVHKTDHFTIFYRAGTASADRIGKAGRQLEKAFRNLKRKGLPVEDRSLAIFLDKPEDFTTVAGMDADRFDGAAMLHYENVDGTFEVRNRVIYINDARFVTGQRLWGMQDRQATITHELVHLYLSKVTRPWIPSWVTEGVAVHFAGQHNSWSRRALRKNPYFEKLTLTELSKQHTLSEGSADANATQAGYLLSGEAFAILDKKGKQRKLLEFYRSYAGFTFESIRAALSSQGAKLPAGQAPSIATAGPVLTDILLLQHFGTDIKTLDSEVKASARKRGF